MSGTAEDTSKLETFSSLVFNTALPLRVIAAAYLGSWIGARSSRYVLGIVVGCIALGYSADFFLSIAILINKDQYKQIFQDRMAFDVYISNLPAILIFMISGAPGFWYGQRQKPAYYLAFIMRMLPHETRQTIVEMAQDEAVLARPPAMQASS